jgi:hypothetical protein
MDRYKILVDYRIEDLEAKVNSYIEKGYLPLGGIVIVEEAYVKYLQPVYKLEISCGNK